jgi:hypothetical protein
MSVFNIAEIYQDAAPRKQWEPSDPKTWILGSQEAFTVVADDGSPKMMNFVSEIRILWKSPTWDESVVGNGLIDIIYPEYDDNTLKTHTIKSLEELQIMADKTVIVGSDTNYIIELKPPVKLEGSNSNRTLTVSKNSNVNDMTGGEVVITAKGWKLKEADF